MKKLILLIMLFGCLPVFASNINTPVVSQNIIILGLISIITSVVLIFLYIKLYKINEAVSNGPEEGWEERAKILRRWSDIKSFFVSIYFFIILGTLIFYRNSSAFDDCYYFVIYSTVVFLFYFLFLIFYSAGSKFKGYERKTNLILIIILPFLIMITISLLLLFLI